jgi:hypothetical protein
MCTKLLYKKSGAQNVGGIDISCQFNKYFTIGFQQIFVPANLIWMYIKDACKMLI